MTRVAKWEIFEYSMYTEKSFKNPFFEVDVTCEFTFGSLSLTADGFYDGEENGKNVWRVRFAPMIEGEWTFKTASSLAEFDGLCGSLVCTAPVSRGPLTINKENPHWFSRADGSPQFIVNDGWFPHVGHEALCEPLVKDDHQQPTEQDFKDFISLLSEHGVNMIVGMTQLYARNPKVFDVTFLWPWKVVDADNNKFDTDYFNLEYFRRWERTLEFAKTKDLFYDYELLYDDSVVRVNDWAHHPINKKNGGWLEGDEHDLGWSVMFDTENAVHMEYTKRYLKYTLARLSCFWNITWEIGAENGNLAMLDQSRLPWAKLPDEYVANYFNVCGDYIAEHDIYSRLKTLGDVNMQRLMVTSRHNDYILTQDPRNYPRGDNAAFYNAMNAFGEKHWKFNRPVVIGEMNQLNNGHYGKERRLYWLAFVSGYIMGRSDRHFELMAEGKSYESRLYGFEKMPLIYRHLKIMSDYINSRKVAFWRMQPADDQIRSGDLVYCLAETGKEYLIYFLYGGRCNVTLPEGKWEMEWLDPTTGVTFGPSPWRPGTKNEIEGGEQSFTCHDTEDFVLHLKKLD